MMSIAITTKKLSNVILADKSIAFSKRERDIMDHYQMVSSEVWLGEIDGDFICAWGLIPPSLLSCDVYMWLYATERVKEHQFVFVRHSQRVIENILKENDAIVGHVSNNSKSSKRWLKWLGATFGSAEATMTPFRIEKHG